MPVQSLQKIIDLLKRDTPTVDVLVTLTALGVPAGKGTRTEESSTLVTLPTTTTRTNASTATAASASPKLLFNLSEIPLNTDILAFDEYCVYSPNPATAGVCDILWPEILAKLDGLGDFANLHQMQVAVIPDATKNTHTAIGGSAQSTLTDFFLEWCHKFGTNNTQTPARPKCIGLLPFVGGHWQDVVDEGANYEAFAKIGDALHTGDWSETYVGAQQRLNCPAHLGGTLVRTKCIVGGCDSVLQPLFGKLTEWIDQCDATDNTSGKIDFDFSCCKLRGS